MRKNTQRVFATLLIAGALTLFGCAGGSGSNSDDDEGITSETSTGDITSDTGTPVSEEPINQSTTQQLPLDVDILFVLDSSESLAVERTALAAALQQFVGELTETGTYTIAFTLGWISEDPDPNGAYDGSGRLYSVDPHPPVLSSASMSPEDIINAVADIMESAQPGDGLADGGEAGLYSLNKLLTKYQSEAQALGFLRPGAAFVAIFLSDENDICSEGTVPDPDGFENTARTTYCGSLTPSSVLDVAQSATGGAPVQFSGVVYTGPDVPSGDENEIGLGYLDAISLSGGVAVDLGSADFSQGAKNVGNAINALAANLQRRFVLTQSPVNPLSIEVLVDDEPVGFEFIEEENAVVLDFAGHPGSVIEINYRILDE